MNRVAVILFALAILLAHSLAIHQTVDGDYAAPYDFAHVAYRVARNLVRDGSFAWNPGGALYESYPSPAWVLIAGIAERFYWGPNQLTQAVGTACVLITVVVLAQFSSKRLGGMIAPVLLAVSGAVAAAGGSGTEAGLSMLLLTAAVFGFERGKRSIFATACALLLWTRPEATVFVLLMLLLDLFDRPKDVFGVKRTAMGTAFGGPLVAWIVLLFLRRFATGNWLSPYEQHALDVNGERFSLGLDYLNGFFLCSGSGLLIVLPIFTLLLGKLTGTGRRALIIGMAWALLVASNGGDPLPFWNALVPVLPIFFLAIQESITGWLDRQPLTTIAFWAILVLSVASSLVVSRMPSDIGPLRFEPWHRAWMEPQPSLMRAYGRTHGRVGLFEEIRTVERLRTLGVYLRDRVEDTATLMTFWPGTIGYLSRKKVYDALGRATPLRSEDRPRSWRGHERIDLVSSFQEGADFAIPIVGTLHEGTSPADLLHTWLDRYDEVGDEDDRLLALLTSLAQYELLAVPVPLDSKNPRITAPTPFLVMRDRARGEAPSLSIRGRRDTFRILAEHESNQQVADLTITVECEDGSIWHMRPTGEFVSNQVAARANLLIFPSGTRPIRVAEGRIPAHLKAVKITARLHNPGTNPDVPLAAVGNPAQAILTPR